MAGLESAIVPEHDLGLEFVRKLIVGHFTDEITVVFRGKW